MAGDEMTGDRWEAALLAGLLTGWDDEDGEG